MTSDMAPEISTPGNPANRDLNPDDIPKVLEELYPPDELRSVAKETGMSVRYRKVDPVQIFWVLILSFGVKLERTLAGMKRNYEEWTGKTLCYGSWFERFNPELAAFLKACAAIGLEKMARMASRTLSEKLQSFKDILIIDSTIIRLHEALAKKFPATRSRKVAAGVKVSVLISAVANGPRTVTIHGERTGEVKTLSIGHWIKDRILLFDLGFFKFQLFARIGENGGYFVSRLKENADPIFLSSLKVHRGRAIDLVGKRWSEIKTRLMRDVLDAEVEVSFSRREYNGKRSRDALKVRMIAVYNEDAERYHVYLTNIPPDVLRAEDIAALYRVRWAIELVFKELKGHYAIDVVKTTKAYIVECLIWTSILTMLASRRLYSLLLSSAPPEKRARYTPGRWANTFTERADLLLSCLKAHFGFASKESERFDKLAALYERHTLDPHVNRHRLPDGWYA
jgi:putative transposase